MPVCPVTPRLVGQPVRKSGQNRPPARPEKVLQSDGRASGLPAMTEPAALCTAVNTTNDCFTAWNILFQWCQIPSLNVFQYFAN